MDSKDTRAENEISRLSRREFLTKLTAGGITLSSLGLLGACDSFAPTVTNTVTSTVTKASTITNTATNTVTSTATTTVTATPIVSVPPTTTPPSVFPLSVRTRYLHGGTAEQIYKAPPSKPKSIFVGGADIAQFLVHFGLHDRIYSVWGSYTSNRLTPAEDAILQKLDYCTQSFPTTEYVLNAISNGVEFVLSSNPSIIRETIFTRDMDGLNSFGVSYYHPFGAYFKGDRYSDLNINIDPDTQQSTAMLNPDGTTTYSWEEFFAVYRKLGILFDISNLVEEYVEGQMAIIEYIRDRASAATGKPTVLFTSYGNGSYSNGLMQLMCETAGGTYLTGTWSNETILELDPDIMIARRPNTTVVPYGELPVFADLKCVKNGTCYNVEADFPYTTNSAGLLVGSIAATVANLIHPEWRTG